MLKCSKQLCFNSSRLALGRRGFGALCVFVIVFFTAFFPVLVCFIVFVLFINFNQPINENFIDKVPFRQVKCNTKCFAAVTTMHRKNTNVETPPLPLINMRSPSQQNMSVSLSFPLFFFLSSLFPAPTPPLQAEGTAAYP